MPLRRLFAFVLVYIALTNGKTLLATERLSLDHAVIVVDGNQPSYVQYGIEEVAGYLHDITGHKPPTVAAPTSDHKVVIAVGPKSVQPLLGEDLPADQLGKDGYLLRSAAKDGKQFLLVAGATPQGTKAGLAALMKTIEVENKSAFVPADLDRAQKPPIATRGMHFNGWAFTGPYSFRNWREQDWKSYLDILAYQGVNLFYLWPFIEIMPVPLSPEDEEYLQECRRVVDYAHEKHGMEVWVMQCTNRVAKDDCGVKEPRRRPYWRPSQQDLNPGDAADFKRIMDSREAMYKIINNADGVCNIDADPGECPGSPLSDYLKVLNGCRDLLDRHNVHGKDAKLISWMWTGWGVEQKDIFNRDHQAKTLQLLKSDLREPWSLVAGTSNFLPICRKVGLLPKTVYLHYGVIEGEPAYPNTNLTFNRVRDMFTKQVDKNPELAGVMGNLQTPLLQFPNMYFFTSAMTDVASRKRPEKQVLLELSGHLYPDHKQLIADCYLALQEVDPAKIKPLTNQLVQLIQTDKLGRLGVFGRKLFPKPSIVAQSLVLQLNYRAAIQQLADQLLPATSAGDSEKFIAEFFDAYLAWDAAHGWHGLWGWDTWPLGGPALEKWLVGVSQNLAKVLGSEAAVDAFFDKIEKPLMTKYEQAAVQTGCIAPLKKAVLEALARVKPDTAK